MPLGCMGNDEGKTRWPNTKHPCGCLHMPFFVNLLPGKKRYVGDSLYIFFEVIL